MMTRYFVLASVVVLLIVPAALGRRGPSENYGEDGKDVCGDPLPNRETPREIIEYLANTEDTKKTYAYLNEHPFIIDAESGKLDRARMVNFIANYARHLQIFNRNLATALNAFGSAWPVVQRRELLRTLLDVHRERLVRLDPLAKAFGIDSMESLMKFEPNQNGLILASHTAEIVNHAHDVSELTAAVEVRWGMEADLHRRIKNALMNANNVAYKPWKLNAEMLRFFDFDIMDMGELKRMNDAILTRAVDEGMLLCMLRRRMAQVNNGDVYFWDAALERSSASTA